MLFIIAVTQFLISFLFNGFVILWNLYLSLGI